MNRKMTIDRARELLHHKKGPQVLLNGETKIKYEKRSNKEIRSIIDALEDEYTPIIEMSNAGANVWAEYLEKGYFEDFVQEIWVDQDIREKLFEGLSIEDMMFAWLYPKRIVVEI